MNSRTLALVTSLIVVLLVAPTAAAEEADYHSCVSYHQFGAGASFLRFCINFTGLVMELESPAGAPHISPDPELDVQLVDAYRLCDVTSSDPAAPYCFVSTGWDVSREEIDWDGLPEISTPGVLPFTVTRHTSRWLPDPPRDGASRFTLRQRFTANVVEQELRVQMTVTNHTAVKRTITIERWTDLNVDGTQGGDRFDATVDAVTARDVHGIMLAARSAKVPHTVGVIAPDPDEPGPILPPPTLPGDYAALVRYGPLSVPAKSSVTVQFIYRRY